MLKLRLVGQQIARKTQRNPKVRKLPEAKRKQSPRQPQQSKTMMTTRQPKISNIFAPTAPCWSCATMMAYAWCFYCCFNVNCCLVCRRRWTSLCSRFLPAAKRPWHSCVWPLKTKIWKVYAVIVIRWKAPGCKWVEQKQTKKRFLIDDLNL